MTPSSAGVTRHVKTVPFEMSPSSMSRTVPHSTLAVQVLQEPVLHGTWLGASVQLAADGGLGGQAKLTCNCRAQPLLC